jgi:hypothetical protein
MFNVPLIALCNADQSLFYVVYFNSLLASLNMRSSLRADAGMSEASDRPHSGYAMEPTASSHDGGRSFGRKRALSESQVAIRVHTIREYMVDTIQVGYVSPSRDEGSANADGSVSYQSR